MYCAACRQLDRAAGSVLISMGELSAAEAAIYDRQLRVWGVEVQKRSDKPARLSMHTLSFGLLQNLKAALFDMQAERCQDFDPWLLGYSCRGVYEHSIFPAKVAYHT